MPSHEERHTVPWSPDQMFELVLNVERYPEFIPGYQEAQVEHRHHDRLQARQRIGLGAVNAQFRSTAQFHRPHHIRIRSHDAPFDALRIDWEFSPAGAGCEVCFRVEFRLENSLTARLLQPWLDALGGQLPAAFLRRAQALYGGPAP